MTRQFNQYVNCPRCGEDIPAETAFCSWMRSRPELDSRDGVVRADCDHIVHRYKFPGSGREIQAIMLIEVKTYVDFTKSDLIQATERDTLHIINQLARNRRSNMHKKNKWQAGNGPLKAMSLCAKRLVQVRFCGVHGLYFSGTDPDNSNRIQWDTHLIDPFVLLQLLRFDLDPDTLKPFDLRIHHKPHPNLPGM